MCTEAAPGATVLDAGCVGQALALSAEAGWNQDAADWSAFIEHGTVWGVFAGGVLVATAAALPYGAFGWVSMVLVTPAWRRQGLATRLVRCAIASLRDTGRAAFLDATPDGAAVYARLGFVPLCGMARWSGLGGGRGPGVPAVDFTRDATAFGADRRVLLQGMLARPHSRVIASGHGFALLRPGRRAMQIGPLVAEADGARLLSAAIDAAEGPVLIDVLEAGNTLLPVLEGRGFRLERGFTRMALGQSHLPGTPAHLLAAAGPEFG